MSSPPTCSPGSGNSPKTMGENDKVHVQEAKKIIEEHDKSKPMFLYLAFMAVHTPFVGVPPKKFRKMISNKARKDTFEESPHDLRDMVLASVDEAIDKVILKLKETGIYNNSVILVTTDNGGGPWYSNSPLKGTKETMYEGGIRGASFLLSPLLARSGESDQLIHLVDWLPTFLNLAGKQTTVKLTSSILEYIDNIKSIIQSCHWRR